MRTSGGFIMKRPWLLSPVGVGIAVGIVAVLALLIWQYWGRAPLIAMGLAAGVAGAVMLSYPLLGLMGLAIIVFTNITEFIPGLTSPLMALIMLVVVARKLLAADWEWNIPNFLRWTMLFLTMHLVSTLWGGTFRYFEWSDLYRVLLICLVVVELVKTREAFLNTVAAVQLAIVITAILTIRSAAEFYASGIASQVASTVGDVDKSRFFGIWPDPNIMALTVIPLIGFSLALLRSREVAVWRRWLSLFAVASSITTVMLSLSRGGMICVAIVVGIFAFADPRRWRIVAAVAVLVILVVSFLPIDLFGRVASLANPGGDASLNQRSEVLKGGIQMVSDSFPFGWGYGNFRTHSTDYVLILPWSLYAHNTYLEILVEAGVLGLFFYLGAVVSVLLGFDWRHRRLDPGNLVRNLHIGASSGILAMLAGIALLSMSGYIVVWFYLSLAVVMQQPYPKQEKSIQPRLRVS